jgi:hypothetical protein
MQPSSQGVEMMRLDNGFIKVLDGNPEFLSHFPVTIQV